MEARLADFVNGTAQGKTAEAILRKCVHCGFCNATCPTYQLLGDELDGPRGRIYQIKQMLEGEPVSDLTSLHLDRCLGCLACETTCPSGVEYGRLLDIGRAVAEQRVPRPLHQRALRRLIRTVMTSRRGFGLLLAAGRALRVLLPPALRRQIPRRSEAGDWPVARHARRMIVLDGCVQPAIAPRINAAAARVLDRLGISLVRVEGAGCCGALSHHLGATGEALDFVRRNIDAWWDPVERGAEAIVMTASGCGSMVRDYGELLRDDPVYAERARRIATLTRDLSEVLAGEDIGELVQGETVVRRIAYQSPCSLQHGQRLGGTVERILVRAGFDLVPVSDPHLCCGSAGTYSLLQPALARRLQLNKLRALQAGDPELIATANIGCLNHLQGAARVPVRHWIELLDH